MTDHAPPATSHSSVVPAAQRPMRLANADLLQSPPTMIASTAARIQRHLAASITSDTPIDDVVMFVATVMEVLASHAADDARSACLCLLAALFDDTSRHSAVCYRALKTLEVRRKSLTALSGQVAATNDVRFPVVSASRSGPTGGGGEDHPMSSQTPGLSPVRSTNDSSIVAGGGTAPDTTTRVVVGDHHRPDRVAPYVLDVLLADPIWRPAAVRLMRNWDAGNVDVSAFVENPGLIHLYLPHRIARADGEPRVYRDFIVCTPRPKLTQAWGTKSFVHIKTNIPAKSDVMYRILVEGYNYGVNAPICSDVVGCTHRAWDEVGRMEKYGWPEGWDAHSHRDYAPGATIHQYYSSDHFLVVRLEATSFFSVGFSASAWLVTPGYGAGFPIAATVHHQDDTL